MQPKRYRKGLYICDLKSRWSEKFINILKAHEIAKNRYFENATFQLNDSVAIWTVLFTNVIRKKRKEKRLVQVLFLKKVIERLYIETIKTGDEFSTQAVHTNQGWTGKIE